MEAKRRETLDACSDPFLSEVYFSGIAAEMPVYSNLFADAVEAIEKYGALKGGWLAFKGICRCHPFSKHDIYDPVP